MKTKNLMLGLFALVAAVGSAFASLNVAPPDYISVLRASTGVWACERIANGCNEQGTIPCQVDVQPLNKFAQVFDLDTDEVDCTLPLTDDRPVIQLIVDNDIIDVVEPQ